jgi:hypothetical protein
MKHEDLTSIGTRASKGATSATGEEGIQCTAAELGEDGVNIMGEHRVCMGAIQPRDWGRATNSTFHRVDQSCCQDHGHARSWKTA